MAKIRIFHEEKNFLSGKKIKITDGDFDYLSKVMRQKISDKIRIFNGHDGEFEAEIIDLEKKFLTVELGEKIADLHKVANITLAFAPVKNVRIDFIATKACELGLARFQPIITRRTIVDKINLDRFKANVKEACEQCERNDFPEIFAPKKLENFLKENDVNKKIFILCDETHQGLKASKLLPELKTENKEIVILIGPEGGFAPEEFEKMRSLPNLFSMSLGPRILRADTAIISALTLVQEFLGDF